MAEPNQGIAPPDFNHPIGQVRLLVGDTDPKIDPQTPAVGTYMWYSDEELGALLKMYDESPKRVAVRVLRNVALSNAMKLKNWSSDTLRVDGAAVAAQIANMADKLEGEANAEDGRDSDDFFQIVPTGGVDHLASAMKGEPHFPWPVPPGADVVYPPFPPVI